MKNRKRNIQLNFRVSEKEQALIHQKMEQVPTKNMAAYLRKMAVDGYVIQVELEELRILSSLLQRSSNNMNQIAKRVNATGRMYAEDLEDLRKRQEEILSLFRSVIEKIADV